MPLVTVPGVASSTIQVQFQTAENTFRAEELMAEVYAANAASTLSIANTPTVSPAPSGDLNEYTIGDAGGVKGAGPTQGTVPLGYLAIVDNQLSSVPVQIVGANQANESVLATGSLQFLTEAGSGTVVSAQGNNVVTAPNTGGGNWDVYFDTGSNTVYATSGNFLVQTDTSVSFGQNLLWLGSGNDTIVSWGQDTIVAGPAGNNLIALNHGQSLYYGNSGASTVIAAAGGDTVVQGGGKETVFAAASGLYFGNGGALTFVAGGGTAPTVVAGSGNATLYGDAGSSGTFFVGPGQFLLDGGGGDQTVVAVAGSSSNDATLFAENGGSMNLFGDTSGNLLIGGAGAATLNAAGASGANWLLAGSGADSLVAGTGADTLVGGPGTDTLVGSMTQTVFEISHAFAGGHELIANWNSSDRLWLAGYGAATTPGGLPAGASLSAGQNGTVLSLPDGTSVTFANTANVNPAQFVTS